MKYIFLFYKQKINIDVVAYRSIYLFASVLKSNPPIYPSCKREEADPVVKSSNAKINPSNGNQISVKH